MNVDVMSEMNDEFEPDDAVDFSLANDEEVNDMQPEREREVVIRVVDERANIPVNEVTERFLRAVLAKVPLERIEELHLFSPLRQGTVETGIAVVAARVIVMGTPVAIAIDSAVEEDDNGPDEDTDAIDPADLDIQGEVIAAEAEVDVEGEAPDEPYVSPYAAESAAFKDVSVDASVEAVVDASVDTNVDASFDANVDASVDVSVDAEVDADVDSDAEATIDPTEFEDLDVIAPRIRHTVYTARYRLVVKGPERGNWEMDVVDEADAPLLAVETVVRGVQRRAGEDTATVRYDAAQLARVLRIPLPESR